MTSDKHQYLKQSCLSYSKDYIHSSLRSQSASIFSRYYLVQAFLMSLQKILANTFLVEVMKDTMAYQEVSFACMRTSVMFCTAGCHTSEPTCFCEKDQKSQTFLKLILLLFTFTGARLPDTLNIICMYACNSITLAQFCCFHFDNLVHSTLFAVRFYLVLVEVLIEDTLYQFTPNICRRSK